MLNREHSACTLTINKVTQLSTWPKCKTPELWRETRTFWNNLIFTAEQSDPLTVGFTQHLSGSINQKLFEGDGGGGGGRVADCKILRLQSWPPGNGLWQTTSALVPPVCCSRSTLLGEESITGLISSYTLLQGSHILMLLHGRMWQIKCDKTEPFESFPMIPMIFRSVNH